MIFLFLGISGFLGMFGAFSLFAFFFWKETAMELSPIHSLLVLLPAHNEATTLAQTISSIRAAANKAGIPCRIVVGADFCNDNTLQIARSSGAEVVEFFHRSKWLVLKNLFAVAKKDETWIAFVDAGARWPDSLLQNLKPHLQNDRFFAVAPTYRPENASKIDAFLWSVEAKLKKFENRFGGPISVHGATVFYRTDILVKSFSLLEKISSHHWLNDDIALPLAAHIVAPQLRNFYSDEKISDLGVQENAQEIGRRKRMVFGNFQWITLLWPETLHNAPASAILALRRIFRLFWAYWPIFLLLGLFPQKWQVLVLLVFCYGLSYPLRLRALRAAANASLLSPLLLFKYWRRPQNQKWN